MRHLLSVLIVASAVYGQASPVTSVSYDSLSHSTLRINFTTSATFAQDRIRYIDTTTNPGGICTNGSGGAVTVNYVTSSGAPTYGYYQMVVGGLTPGHTYSFCPEITGSVGGAYSTGGPSISVTMPSLPAVHPAPPIAPATFTTTSSSESNTPGLTLTLGGANCANFQACLQYAVGFQGSESVQITIPAGVPASSIGGVGPFGGEGIFQAPDVVTVTSSQVNSSTTTACTNISANAICVTNHGLTEGSQAVFGVSYGCLPGNQSSQGTGFLVVKSGSNNKTVPFQVNYPYYVHVLDANTFQLYTCPMANADAIVATADNTPLYNNGTAPACSFGGGTLLTFADQGSGTMRYAAYPRKLHWITVRTSTPDSQFVPEGSSLQGPPDGSGVPTRPTQWLPLMGNLQVPLNSSALIALGDFNTNPMPANIRFIGIHFSYTDTTEAGLSSDPSPGNALMSTSIDSTNIFWDRCYFDAPGTPFRMAIGFTGRV